MPTPFLNSLDLSNADGIVRGENIDDRSRQGISSAGDVDGVGLPDVLIVHPNHQDLHDLFVGVLFRFV